MPKLIDHDGHVAVLIGSGPAKNSPVNITVLYVYVGKAYTNDYRRLMGRKIRLTGNTGVLLDGNKRFTVYLDTDDWERVVIEEPIRKPRRGTKGGRRYDWQWEDGRWEKVYG